MQILPGFKIERAAVHCSNIILSYRYDVRVHTDLPFEWTHSESHINALLTSADVDQVYLHVFAQSEPPIYSYVIPYNQSLICG